MQHCNGLGIHPAKHDREERKYMKPNMTGGKEKKMSGLIQP
jgi:hypothetical protein